MVRAWYLLNESSYEPTKLLNLQELKEVTGMEHIQVDLDTHPGDGVVDRIKTERGYGYEDLLDCSKDTLENYEEKLKAFYTEHLHTEEEIRLIAKGTAYFDVREKDDEWIRVELRPGDMIVIPSGLYHRFSLGPDNYVMMRRYFVKKPTWDSHKRPSADNFECRKEYLSNLKG